MSMATHEPMTEEEWLKPWEYRCVLCGWEFLRLRGLLLHIEQAPHWLTLVQYGTLNRAAETVPGREEGR
jgi:hypothetical protein